MTIVFFWGFGLFSGAFAVSFREGRFFVKWHGDFFGGECIISLKHPKHQTSNFWGDDEFENSQALLSG